MIIAASHKHTALLYLVLCGWCVPALAGTSAAKKCHQHIKGKRFKAAGECFTALATSLGPASKLSEEKKYLQGQRLRNAAVAFRKAAQEQPKEAVALRLRALRLLGTYLRDKLCETPARCRLVRGMRQSIRGEIGFTPVAINTGDPKATFTLQGLGTQYRGRGRLWQGKLPPGSYLLTVTYPKGATQAKAFQVTRAQAQVVTFQPPLPQTKPPQRQPPKRRGTPPTKPRWQARTPAHPKPPAPSGRKVWPWIVVGTGAAILVGGVVALAVGKGMEQQTHDDILQRRNGSTLPTMADTTRFNAQYDRADTALLVGWVGLGVGGAVAVTGLVLALLQPGNAKSPPDDFDDAPPEGYHR